MNKHSFSLIAFLSTFLIIQLAYSQSPERKDVPDNHKWNLADIYPSTEAWQNDVDKLKGEVDKLAEALGYIAHGEYRGARSPLPDAGPLRATRR